MSLLMIQAQDNVIKLNLMALPMSNISMGYEKFVNDYVSLQLGAGYKLPTNLGTAFAEEGLGKINGWHITPEVRMYTSGSGRGFYIAPYGRYGVSSISMDILNYTDENGIDFQLDATGYNREIGVGLQLGAQWFIGDKISVDWFFLGPRRSFMRAGIKISGSDAIADWADVGASQSSQLENYGVLDVRTNSNSVDVSAPWKFFGLRTGLSVGIAL